jgi:thioredoxin reductase (NADPH)
MLVRRDVMRASKAMQDRVLRHPKITVHWNTEPVDVLGNGVRMTGLRLRDTRTGDERDIPMGGLFYAIGHTPNTGLFRGQLELDDVGYVVTKPSSVATSVEGVFAAGDVQDHEFRQAITAAGTGCMAAMLAERWLSANGLDQEFHHQAEEPDRLYAATIPFESLVTDVEFGDSESTPADPPSAAVDAGTGAEPAASAPTQTTADDLDLSKTHHEGGYALRRLYHETDKLILVKYTSPTCGPCHTLKPILNKVVDEFTGQIYTVEIDISLEPEIAEAGGVTGTPTVQLFKQKDKVGQVMGVKPKSQYRELIEKYL